MLNFLSFLVLLYVSGHFKQKKLIFFWAPDCLKNSANKLGEFVIFDNQSEVVKSFQKILVKGCMLK